MSFDVRTNSTNLKELTEKKLLALDELESFRNFLLN